MNKNRRFFVIFAEKSTSMKKSLFLAFAIFMTAFTASAKKDLNAYISYSVFMAKDGGNSGQPYIETYITFDRSSLTYIKTDDGKFEADINITVLFKQGEVIQNYGKYAVRSPKVNDTTAISGFFMDAQRYFLPNGDYTLSISMSDNNNKSDSPIEIAQDIVIDMPDNLCFSNILAIESFTKSESTSVLNKNGYELVPMLMPYYPEKLNKLTFYTEIYNSDVMLGADEKYILNTYIVSAENNVKLNNFFFSKRMTTKNAEAVINTFDITDLPSGNYYLILEAKNRNNETIGLNRMFFQRSNPNYHIDEEEFNKIELANVFTGEIDDIDTIKEYVRCLNPISSEVEREYAAAIAAKGDKDAMQRFFYSFWASRNSVDPESAWQKYYKQVKAVNNSYKTPSAKGYETDRGHIYLKYGTPDRIVQSYSEPGAYPYEIWHYYVLSNGQRNKKFVFMTRDIATNDFQLIHSDAVGELNNFRWQTEIYFRTYGTYNDYGTDGTADSDKSYGDHAGDYYNNPR